MTARTRRTWSPIEGALLWAGELDVRVRKPGNVSVASPGHGMVAAQFVASIEAAAAPLAARGAPVGARIEAAVARSLAVAGCNTNLGIVLLCAPIAAAVERVALPLGEADLRRALREVLAALDLDDARAAFRAIAAANPGGLGRAAAQDVAAEPTVGLRQAMELATGRDSIARQYSTGFADLFDVGLAAWRAAGPTPERAMFAAWLAFLAHWPDSHIVRKHGLAAAQTVTAVASRWYAELRGQQRIAHEPDAVAVAAWDDQLKSDGINPGTSADLAVATAFVAALLDPSLAGARATVDGTESVICAKAPRRRVRSY